LELVLRANLVLRLYLVLRDLELRISKNIIVSFVGFKDTLNDLTHSTLRGRQLVHIFYRIKELSDKSIKGAFENPVGGRMKFSELGQGGCNQALFGAGRDIQHHFSFCQPENPQKTILIPNLT